MEKNMEFSCCYCKTIFSTKTNLIKHQRTAKYCIKIKSDLDNYKCVCGIEYSSERCFETHKINCVKYQKNQTKKCHEHRLFLEKQKHNEQINKLQEQIKEISMVAIQEKNDKILNMINKYVKKQPRQQFEEKNVIYILTTSSLKKDRRYILGKAKNLTNRLSTYNKTDEHEVIFYQECNDEEDMNFLEPLVFKKLNEYREQANRERFILPENKDIDFFINTIKDCLNFLK